MNRRGFLSVFGLGAAGLVLDPERLLWVPGARRIFDLGGIAIVESSGNTFLTADWVAREALAVFARQLALMTVINRQYDAAFDGTTIAVRVG